MFRTQYHRITFLAKVHLYLSVFRGPQARQNGFKLRWFTTAVPGCSFHARQVRRDELLDAGRRDVALSLRRAAPASLATNSTPIPRPNALSNPNHRAVAQHPRRAAPTSLAIGPAPLPRPDSLTSQKSGAFVLLPQSAPLASCPALSTQPRIQVRVIIPSQYVCCALRLRVRRLAHCF